MRVSDSSAPVVRLPLKVVPGASRDQIAGWHGDRLRLRISAAPERGRANRAVEKLLAQKLGLPIRAVRIVAGHASAQKSIEIEGLSKPEIVLKLELD